MRGKQNLGNDQSFDIVVKPALLVKTALSFPCFSEANPKEKVNTLFDVIIHAYKDDNLTEEQDLVVEFVLHMTDEQTPFNLKRALEVWTVQDRAAFIKIIGARR